MDILWAIAAWMKIPRIPPKLQHQGSGYFPLEQMGPV